MESITTHGMRVAMNQMASRIRWSGISHLSGERRSEAEASPDSCLLAEFRCELGWELAEVDRDDFRLGDLSCASVDVDLDFSTLGFYCQG